MDSFTKDHSMNESMNYKGVCRTAPAEPGLSNIATSNKDLVFIKENYVVEKKHTKQSFFPIIIINLIPLLFHSPSPLK